MGEILTWCGPFFFMMLQQEQKFVFAEIGPLIYFLVKAKVILFGENLEQSF